MWRVLVAPGDPDDPDDPLPVPDNAWVWGRQVRMPEEHWSLVLELASLVDADAADLLARATFAGDVPNDEIQLDEEQTAEILQFVDTLVSMIEAGPPLVPEATEDLPDAYTNAEHINMLRNVAAVLAESQRLGEPYEAWVE
jgi:hypothetical protein